MDKEIITKIKNLQGIAQLIEIGEVYLVGGAVRDLFLNKPSKDIDLVVCKIYFEDVKNILSKFGRVDIVGESYGILKYKPNGWNEDEAIDIALPRTERKTGLGHKDFDTISDPLLPIEIELERRDFTINAMSLDMRGNLIDPFNGMSSLLNKKLLHVSNQSFCDDPLRMLRGIQFASRFDFDFEDSTWDLIQMNKQSIVHITGERILTELDKIYIKGNKLKGLELLKKSGLGDIIFPNFTYDENVEYSKTRYDFFSFLVKDGEEFKKILKGDNDTADGIDAYNIVRNTICEEISDIRHIIFKAHKKSPSILESGILNKKSTFSPILNEFRDGIMPKFIKDIKVNGHDLLSLGFKNKEIGIIQNKMLDGIFKDVVVNEKESLLDFLTK